MENQPQNVVAPEVKKKKKNGCLIAVLVVLGFFIIGAIGNSSDSDDTNLISSSSTENSYSTSQQDTSSSEETKDEGNWKKAGQYKVGTDIPAGEYVVEATGINCYIEVASDSSGEFSSIISNDNLSSHTYITVQDGQYFTVKGGRFIPEAEATPYTAENGVYPAGKYKVGKDIPAGEYKVKATGTFGSYIEVSTDSSGVLTSIRSNDNIESDAEIYVTINDGEYIKVVNGEIIA